MFANIAELTIFLFLGVFTVTGTDEHGGPIHEYSSNGWYATAVFIFFQLELVVCNLHHPCLYHLPCSWCPPPLIRGQQVQDQEAQLDGAVHHDVRGAEGWSCIRSRASHQ